MTATFETNLPKTRQEAYLLNLISDVVTLDKELDNLHKSVLSFREVIPALADKEMKRAGDVAIASLAGRVASIANNIAGDAAKAERNKSTIKVTQLHIGALVLSAIVFGGAGVAFGIGINAVQLGNAKELVAESNKAVGQAKADAAAEIEQIRVVSKWAGTPDGKLAKQFFDLGGKKAALCDGKSWTAKVAKDKTRWCIFGSEGQKDGWLIP